MEIKFGNFSATNVVDVPQRMNMLIWGASGCGKTTLASTAPGKKLWILFDPDGTTSLLDVKNRDEIQVIDLSKCDCNIIAQLAAENCMGLDKILTDNPEIKTVVLDSVTTLLDKCLQLGVMSVRGASEMTPTLQGYGNRKYYLEKVIKNLVKITAKCNKHLILLAHEDSPSLDSDGCVQAIEPLMGGKSAVSLPIILSEVWNMYIDGKDRKIRIKQNAIRKPMKSRMFKDVQDFVWKYTPEQGGTGIKEWYDEWVKQKTKITPF